MSKHLQNFLKSLQDTRSFSKEFRSFPKHSEIFPMRSNQTEIIPPKDNEKILPWWKKAWSKQGWEEGWKIDKLTSSPKDNELVRETSDVWEEEVVIMQILRPWRSCRAWFKVQLLIARFDETFHASYGKLFSIIWKLVNDLSKKIYFLLSF